MAEDDVRPRRKKIEEEDESDDGNAGLSKFKSILAQFPKLRMGNTVLILVAILSVASTFFTSFVVTHVSDSPKADTKIEETSHKKESKQHKKKKDKEAPAFVIIPLAPFTVNLLDYEGRRYLRVAMDVELDKAPGGGGGGGHGGGEGGASFGEDTPKIRNAIIDILSDKSFSDVQSVEGKDKIRQDIIARINEILAEKEVKCLNCYFTDFTAQ